MPRVIQTTGDRGHDEELDRLWREIDALKAKPASAGQTTTIIQQAPAKPVQPGVAAVHWHIIGNI